jgi:hypothetical protein
MKLLGKSTQYEHVVAFMKDELAETDLTPHEQELVKRWNEAWTLMRSGKSTADAAAILMKRFTGLDGKPLSRATAYRDCSNAISMFGDFSVSTKDGIKHLTTEMVRDASVIARAKNNEDGMIKAALAIARINGVNTTDPDLPDMSKLDPHTYVMQMDPLTIKAFHHLIKTGRIDLQMLADAMNELAETVEYEMVKEVPGGDS